MAPLPKAIRRAAKLALSGATVIVSLVASLSGSTPALAGFQVGVYAGWNDNFDSDIALKQPNGTNMTLHDVA